jgi:putative membrane protein
MSKMKTFMTVLAAGIAVGACSKDNSADTTASVDSTAAMTTATTPPPPAAITDPQIAKIVVTANSGDSAAGELAKTKGTDKDVKAFGQRMVTDHGAVNKEAVALVTKLNVTPEESDASRSMASDAQSNMTALQGQSGAAFDKAYIDHEVTMHQQVLDALDNQLIPNAQNADLKALLQKVRPAIAAHLESAKTIQTKLGSSK